jgi:hypothetical protein
MVLPVQYLNQAYDFVTVKTLARLLMEGKIRYFYRPSEKRWIDAYLDPIRGSGGRYSGPERRHLTITPKR